MRKSDTKDIWRQAQSNFKHTQEKIRKREKTQTHTRKFNEKIILNQEQEN